MELQIEPTQPNPQSSTDPDSSPAPKLPPVRCQARNRNGSRCRLHAQDPATRLCHRHADRAGKFADSFDDTSDLSTDLFGPNTPSFQSAEEINAALTNLVILVAQGRVSPRRAWVITYSLGFIQKGRVVIDKKAASQPDQIIIDIDSAVARSALAAQEQPQSAQR